MPLLKPDACHGCAFEKMGKYYTPDTVVQGSEVMFIAQNPGPDEEEGKQLIARHWVGAGEYVTESKAVTPQPLIGATGQAFNTTYLGQAHLYREQVSVGNAIRCRPGHNLGLRADELPPLTNKMVLQTSKAPISQALRHCAAAYLKIPESVKVIVTMGSHALFQMTGQNAVTDWRGYAIRTTRDHLATHHSADCTRYHDVAQVLGAGEIDIFATMHIAALYKGANKKYHHAMLRDFHKIGRYLRGEWPSYLPTWSAVPPANWPKYSAFDTEYTIDTNTLIRWSLCDVEGNLYCIESDPDRVSNTGLLPVNQGTTVVIQNALADLGHLSGIIPLDDVMIEDLMLAHATLYTGEPHSLNYLNSIWGAFNRYKHLSQTEEQLYSALDAYEPMHIWRYGIMPEFRRDPPSWDVYKRFLLPLIPIIDKAQRAGVKLNGQRLVEVKSLYEQRIEEIIAESRTLTGKETFAIGGITDITEELYA